MADRSRDWFAQAERDLEQARASQGDGRHEWACFAAHQAAEKAVQAIHLALGQDAWGNVVREMLVALDDRGAESSIDKARVLDTFYVPARYPLGGPPKTTSSRRAPDRLFRVADRRRYGVGSDADIVVLVDRTDRPPREMRRVVWLG